MKWIEVKMRELGVSTHSDYKVTAFMDHTAMVTVHTAERGDPFPQEHLNTHVGRLLIARTQLGAKQMWCCCQCCPQAPPLR